MSFQLWTRMYHVFIACRLRDVLRSPDLSQCYHNDSQPFSYGRCWQSQLVVQRYLHVFSVRLDLEHLGKMDSQNKPVLRSRLRHSLNQVSGTGLS